MVLNYDNEIEMLLFDQNKIVTYKQLNNRFELTPNEAKKILNEFITKKRKSAKTKAFHATYLIIAEDLKDSKKKRIFLSKEDDLDKSDDLKILSKQIYAIHADEINDYNLIYASDLDASQSLERKSNLTVIMNATVESENDAGSKLETLAKTSLTISDANCKPKDRKIAEDSKSNQKENKAATSTTKNEHQQAKTDHRHEEETSNKKQKVDTHSDSKVKQEPTPPAAKAAKQDPAPAKKTNDSAKFPSKKANQQTLTSFFKKA